MNTKNPLITIGVSTYNRKDLLRESLKSLTCQTLKDYEIIVVDDGSSDGTEEMVRSEFPDVRYFYKQNGGDGSAKNYAAWMGKGKYIVFNDSDDCFYPDTLERLYEPLRIHPDSCSYGQYNHLDIHGNESKARLKMKIFPSGNILPHLIRHIIVHCTACMMPRDLFLACGGFDETLKTGHDYKFILECALRCQYYAIQKPVFQRRRHSENLSASDYDRMKRQFSVIYDFAERHPEIFKKYKDDFYARFASSHLTLAREARKKNLSGKIIKDHLKESISYRFSFKALLRLIFW